MVSLFDLREYKQIWANEYVDEWGGKIRAIRTNQNNQI